MDLRKATDRDVDALFEIYKEVFRWRIETLFVWADHWQKEHFLQDWPRCHTEVVELDGKVSGFIQTQVGEGEIYLVNIALTKSVQNKGIGNKLIDLLKKRCSSSSKRLHLSVYKINEKAQSFYRKNGFTVFNETDQTLKMEWLASAKSELIREQSSLRN